MREKVIILYEYLYGITTGNKMFSVNRSEATLKIIDNFVGKLTASHGEDWLFEFLCYQFSRYADLETRFGKGKILIGWVLGNKAINKYKDATAEEKFYGEKFRLDYGVRNILVEITPVLMTSEYKNRERSRFLGTERGLIHCHENDLWEEGNKFCFSCKFKSYCKK